MKPEIAIICPTRNRIQMLLEFIASLSATDTAFVRCLYGVNSDDPAIGEYSENGIYVHQFEPYHTVGHIWNSLADMAVAGGSRIIMMANDDQIFRTYQWDRMLINRLSTCYVDDIYCAHVDDGFKHETHCAFPIVSAKWIRTVGYFVPPYFEFGYHDTWLMDVAKRIGRLLYIPDILIDHMHFTRDGGYARDDTTEHARKNGQASRDKRIFECTDYLRQRDANKLLEVMT